MSFDFLGWFTNVLNPYGAAADRLFAPIPWINPDGMVSFSPSLWQQSIEDPAGAIPWWIPGSTAPSPFEEGWEQFLEFLKGIGMMILPWIIAIIVIIIVVVIMWKKGVPWLINKITEF